jgi:uncharacterized protein (TIGR03067 family)
MAYMQSVVIALALFIAPAGGPAQDVSAKALTSLQGVWVLKLAEGHVIPIGSPELTVSISGNSYVRTRAGQVEQRGTIKIDAAHRLVAIDIEDSDEPGRLQLGVLEIGDDVICGKLAAPGAENRPTDLTPAEGHSVFVAVRKPRSARPLP